ncbi:MAG: monothiol glutaredoxin, Grx4 family [Myxococcales bacterium]|nr:monothiol glutaredoxin, Grx4 family [Myxococcales bacterium]
MDDVIKQIEEDVKANKVLLYMKGSKVWPQCGFSATVVQILQHLGADFETRNILADQELRAAIKVFSQWPTLPQLYVGGEFVGGCDITRQLFENGELETLLRDAGAISE